MRRWQAVGFDLDGTLWDACEPVRQAWRQELESLGLGELTPTLAQFQAVMGLGPRDLAVRLFPTLEEERAVALARQCSAFECRYLRQHGARPYPGLRQTLAQLGGERVLFVVSNCDAGYIEAFLSHYQLEGYFRAHACAENGKTKGENIAAVLARLGVEEAVYVGDTPGDQAAAAAAGVDFIHAAWGFGRVEGAPSAPSLSALPGLVADLEENR